MRTDMEDLALAYDRDGDGWKVDMMLGAVFQIEAGEGVLAARVEHAPARTAQLTPVDPDAFMLNMVMVRFHRDEAGNVVGLDYSNPAVRDLRFTRLSDGSRAGG